jgi:hypothetical protein
VRSFGADFGNSDSPFLANSLRRFIEPKSGFGPANFEPKGQAMGLL